MQICRVTRLPAVALVVWGAAWGPAWADDHGADSPEPMRPAAQTSDQYAVPTVEPAAPESDPDGASAAGPEPGSSEPVVAEREASGDAEPVSAETNGALPEVLTLAEAQAWALRDNPSLQAAEERVEQARQRAAQARALFFPTVQASAGVSKTWIDENTERSRRSQALRAPFQSMGSSSGATSSQGLPILSALGRYANALGSGVYARDAIDDDATTYSGSLTAQWLLFDGFQREFDYAAARLASKVSEAAYLEAKRQLLAAVATAYHAAALARENMRIATADEAFNVRQLEDAQARRRAGAGSLSDELNFQVRVNTARAARIRAEESYRVARVALAQLMSAPGGVLPESVDLAPLAEEAPEELDIPAADALVQVALTYRPDLLQSALSLERARKLVRSARGAFLPTLTASAGRSAQKTSSWFGQDDFSTAVGINASYTLFAGGRTRAALHEAKAAEREAGHSLASREDEVTASVREACENLLAVQKQLWLERANSAFVQQNRDLVEKEYNAGQASLVRLNEAQRDLTSALANLAAARVRLRQSWHDLRTATGETITPYLTEHDLGQHPVDLGQQPG